VPQVRVRSWDANLGITVRNASLEMQRTYRLLFVFGNLVRRFIDQRFVEEDKKPDWWDGRATAAMKEEGRGSEVRGGEEFMASRPQPPATVLCRLGDLVFSSSVIGMCSEISSRHRSGSLRGFRRQNAAETSLRRPTACPKKKAARLERHLRDWIAQVA